MRTWLILALVAAVLIAAGQGCVNVKTPEGPYVVMGSDSAPALSDTTVNEMMAFLKRARNDGLITDNQYKQLRDRANEELAKSK
ncbi:MAG: hypothetical protein ACYS5V_02900 [Planctomycetota bacterium]|jgi:hypothetical protein